MVTMIAAIGANYELGKDNDLVWHLPDDFKRFKDVSILLSLPLTPCAELTSCTLVCLAGHARPTGPLD